MAVISIPSTAIRQMADQKTLDTAGSTGFSAAWKDNWSVLDGVSVRQGDTFTDGGVTYVVKTSSLRRLPGGLGELVISLAPQDDEDDSGEETVTVAKKETWLCHAVRNDRSILAYCGNGDYDANRAWIECWQRESDAEVAAFGNYTKPDGTVAVLTETLHHTCTFDVIRKIMAGTDSIISFYPLLTRKRQYSDCPRKVMVGLGLIDTSLAVGSGSSGSTVVKAPGNLSSVIAAFQWLKIQDDADELADGDWTRTESWIGAISWDPDLYGANRWSFPHTSGPAET